MVNYKTKRIIDRLKWVVVDETGKVVNNDPSKEELKGLEKELRMPRDTRKVIYYTTEQLLLYLIQFYEKYERPPTQEDFTNNHEQF